MRTAKQLLAGIAVISITIFVSACATTPTQPQAKASVVDESGKTVNFFHWGSVAKPGDTVHLFHGGNLRAKEEFCVNETVPVFRYYGRRYKYSSDVGKVRITGYVGDHYLEAVVVEGEIRDDDVAIKPKSACIIRIPKSDDQ